MEIRHLEMFVALAEVLHFGRAAQRLGCTQPALSRAVQKLEADLGTQLFERDSRNVRMTEAGLAFLAGATDIVDRAAEATRVARTKAGAYLGRLVVGVGLCGQHPPVGRLIRSFRRRHPTVPVSLVSVDEPSIPRVLTDGGVHALVAVDWAFPSGCNVRPLFETELVAIVPIDEPLASKPFVEPRDLDGLELALPCRRQQPMISEHFQEFCDREGIRPHLACDVQTADQLLGLVAGGAAAALMPVSSALQYPGVRVLPFRPAYPLRYCLGWRKASELTDDLVAAADDPDLAVPAGQAS